jgi:DNA-binding beta-propeller fold protein YncE
VAEATPDVVVAGSPVDIAADPATHTFWVAETNTGQPTDIVDKITEAGHKVTTLQVTSGVLLDATDPSRGLVWTVGTSASGAFTASYIQESNNSVHALSVPAPAGSFLTGLAVDRAAGKVFVLDLTGDVFVFDENHLTSAPVKLITGALSVAVNLAVDPGTGTLWMLDAVGNAALEFNESTGAAIGSPVSVGSNPDAIAIDTTTKTVWVGSTGNNTVSEFAEATHGTVHTITLGQTPISLVADPARKTIWAGGGTGAIYAISERTSPPSLAGSLTAPGVVLGLDTDPSTGQLWAVLGFPGQGTHDNVIPFVPASPAFTSAKSTWFAAGNTAQDQFTLTSSGFPPATFSLHGAPSWLSVNPLTGVLSANLTKNSKLGAFKVTINASNGVGSTANQAFTANVGTDPVFIRTSTTFAFGVTNTFQVKAKGTPPPNAFAGINLPKGLHLSTSGLLSGSLPKGTASPVTFSIAASNLVTQTFHSPVTAMFKLKLAPAAAPKFTSVAKVTFRHGRRGVFIVTTTGLPVPTLTESGRPPAGTHFRIRGSRAFLIGTPTAADKGHTFKITITASNHIGKPITQTLAIKIT